MLKVAIIGCGNIGSKRADVAANHPKSKLEIIVDKDIERGLYYSRKFQCNFDINWKTVLRTDVDVVILSTPSNIVYDIASKIINSGRHLLCEKPLGLNLKQAEILTELAIKNNVVLKTGFNTRFDSGVQKAKEIYENGLIGELYFINLVYTNGAVLTNTNNIGSLMDIGIHSINLASWFLGKVNSVFAEIQNKEHSINDNGFIILSNEKVLANIHFSFIRWKNKFHLEISGKEGYVQIDSLPKWGCQTVIHGKRTYPSGPPIEKKWVIKKDTSWFNEWEFFISNINRTSPLYNVYEGCQTMQLVDIANKSAQYHKPINKIINLNNLINSPD